MGIRIYVIKIVSSHVIKESPNCKHCRTHTHTHTGQNIFKNISKCSQWLSLSGRITGDLNFLHFLYFLFFCTMNKYSFHKSFVIERTSGAKDENDTPQLRKHYL